MADLRVQLLRRPSGSGARPLFVAGLLVVLSGLIFDAAANGAAVIANAPHRGVSVGRSGVPLVFRTLGKAGNSPGSPRAPYLYVLGSPSEARRVSRMLPSEVGERIERLSFRTTFALAAFGAARPETGYAIQIQHVRLQRLAASRRQLCVIVERTESAGGGAMITFPFHAVAVRRTERLGVVPRAWVMRDSDGSLVRQAGQTSAGLCRAPARRRTGGLS